MLEDFRGRGWPFPIKLGQNKRLSLLDGNEKIRQSIFLILSTAPGERQMRPEFGCGIYDLVSKPNTPALRGLVKTRVEEALVRYEQRIDVLEVRVTTPPEARNYLLIRIDYRVRSTNAFYNIVYPFFINEGPG
ncbi:MAG: baseplate protein [Anaerolineaceae bacterium]|nr:baseplate protein [Anaerolineaceae bacterium]